LQSCSSVHHTVERIKIYTFLYENFFLLSRALFSRQLTKTAPCYCWGSYSIVSQEGPSCKPSKGQTIQSWINPNKQHLSFSSLFTTRKVLLAKHRQAEFPQSNLPLYLSITTIPPLFFLYLHYNAYEF
jgi:hypothetical protein